MMLNKLDKGFNSKDNLSYEKIDFQEHIESKTDFNNIFNFNYKASGLNFFLKDNYFLEKKRVRVNHESYDEIIEPNVFFDILKDIFSNKSLPEEEKTESIDMILFNPQRSQLFMLKTPHTPGRKIKSHNEDGKIKRKHDKTSYDNVKTKVQVHYISFIINLANDIIFSVFGKNSKKNGLYFIDIDYDIKRNIKSDNFEKLKKLSIKDILLNQTSKKFRAKKENYNKEIFNKLVNCSETLNEYFNMNYLQLFQIYYNNCKSVDIININQKEIKLSNKTKSFFDLIKNKNDGMKKLIDEYTQKAYLHKLNIKSKINK